MKDVHLHLRYCRYLHGTARCERCRDRELIVTVMASDTDGQGASVKIGESRVVEPEHTVCRKEPDGLISDQAPTLV